MSIYDFIYVKKKPRHFIVYILRFHHKTNLYWGIEPLPTTCVVFLSSELFSPFKRNEFMNYCLQDLLESEIYCVWAVLFDLHDNNLNWNLHSVEFNGLIALLFSVNGFFFTINLLGMWAFLFNIIHILYIYKVLFPSMCQVLIKSAGLWF